MSDPLPIIVGVIGKNSREEVRVVLDTFKGTNLVDVRVFAPFSAAGVMMPSRKGISVRVDLLRSLILALQDAESTATNLGWIEGEA